LKKELLVQMDERYADMQQIPVECSDQIISFRYICKVCGIGSRMVSLRQQLQSTEIVVPEVELRCKGYDFKEIILGLDLQKQKILFLLQTTIT